MNGRGGVYSTAAKLHVYAHSKLAPKCRLLFMKPEAVIVEEFQLSLPLHPGDGVE